MEINCKNNCGNLTDSPESDLCPDCRAQEKIPTKKYSIIWKTGQEEILDIAPEQAVNFSMLPNVIQVEPV